MNVRVQRFMDRLSELYDFPEEVDVHDSITNENYLWIDGRLVRVDIDDDELLS